MAEKAQTELINDPTVTIGVVKYLFVKLTAEQRAEVIKDYCSYCWRKLNGPCGCMHVH